MKKNIETRSLLRMESLKNAWSTISDAYDVSKFKKLIGSSLSHNRTVCERSFRLNISTQNISDA